MQNNFVVYADSRLMQYTSSTLPGSSGAPVFNDDFEGVTIHHSSGMIPKPSTESRYLCNEGISLIAISSGLEKNTEIDTLLKG